MTYAYRDIAAPTVLDTATTADTETARLRRDLRWAERNADLYRRLAEGREAERTRHRAEVAHLEQRVDELRRTLADVLARFTDQDRPACGSPRARTWWVDARTLAEWRGQLVEQEPTIEGEAA